LIILSICSKDEYEDIYDIDKPGKTPNDSNLSMSKTFPSSDKSRHFLTQLSHMRLGEKGKVAFIKGGDGSSRRLMDMGLCPGTEFTVVNALPFHGPLEVIVRRTSLVLGRGLAEKVYVEMLYSKEEIEKTSHPVLKSVIK